LTSEGVAGQHNAMIAAPYHTAWKLCAKLRRAMVKHRGREAGCVCRGREGKGAGDQNARFCRSVAQFTGHGRRRAYLSLKSESLKGSRKMSDQERWLNEGLTASWHDRDRGYSLRRPARRRPRQQCCGIFSSGHPVKKQLAGAQAAAVLGDHRSTALQRLAGQPCEVRRHATFGILSHGSSAPTSSQENTSSPAARTSPPLRPGGSAQGQTDGLCQVAP
jgi:hypothetical protein